MNTARAPFHADVLRDASSGVIQAPSSSSRCPSFISRSMNASSAGVSASALSMCLAQRYSGPRRHSSSVGSKWWNAGCDSRDVTHFKAIHSESPETQETPSLRAIALPEVLLPLAAAPPSNSSCQSRIGGGLALQPVHDNPRQLLALVLLQEVAGAGDRGVRLTLGARYQLLQDPLAAAGYGVGVAEGGEERLLPAAQRLPGPAVGGRRRIVGRGWHEHWELTGPRLVAIVRERCVVGRDNFRREGSRAAAPHDAADVEVGRLLGEALPAQEPLGGALVSRGQAGVGGDDAGEALRLFSDEPKAYEPAPVLADQGDVAQVQRLQEGAHPVHVALVRVILATRWLV